MDRQDWMESTNFSRFDGPGAIDAGNDVAASESDNTTSSELAFLVTHWLRHYGDSSAPDQQLSSADDPSVRAELDRVRDLAQQLSEAFANLGAYGSALRSPAIVPSLQLRPLRNATYTDVALRWPSLSSNHLQHLITAAQHTSTASVESAQSTVDRANPVATSLIKRAIEQSHSTTFGHSNQSATEENSDDVKETSSMLQPPTLFSSQMTSTSQNTTTSAQGPNIGQTASNNFPTEPAPVDSASTLALNLSLPLASNPTLVGKRASEASRLYLKLRAEQLQRERLLAKMRRDLDRNLTLHHSAATTSAITTWTATAVATAASVPNPMETERIVAHLSRSIDEMSSKMATFQSDVLQAKKEAEKWNRLYVHTSRNYRNPFQSILGAAGGRVGASMAPFPDRSVDVSTLQTGRGKRNVLGMLTQRNACPSTSFASQRTVLNGCRKNFLAARTTHTVTINAHLFYPVYCLRFDRTGRYFVSGADDHLVKVFRLGNAAHKLVKEEEAKAWKHRGATLVCTLRGHSSVITDIDVSVDNAMLATASEDGDCRIWGLRDGSPIAVLRGHVGGVTMVSFSLTTPYRLVTTAEDGFARMWDVRLAALKRYVSVVGDRKDYTAPRLDPLHTPRLTRGRSAVNIGNSINNVNNDDNKDAEDSQPSGPDGYHHEGVSMRRSQLEDLPLPPLPTRRGSPEGTGGVAAPAAHGVENIDAPLPPIPRNLESLPQGDPPLLVALNGNVDQDAHNNVNRLGAFAPANDDSIVDEGVKLLAKLYHGNDSMDVEPEGHARIETRSQHRKIKVVCLARCPIGGQFATGSEDGLGRIWSDVDDTYSNYASRVDEVGSHPLSIVDAWKESAYAPSTLVSPAGGPGISLQASYLLATLPGHLNAITDLHYSHRGDRILTASQKDGVVRIWSWDNSSEFDLSSHSHFHSHTATTTTTTRAKGLKNVRQVMIRLVPLNTQTDKTSTGSATGRRNAGTRGRSGSSASSSVSSVQCDVAVWTAHDLYIITSQSSPAKQTPSSHQQSGVGLKIAPLSQVLQVWDSRDGQCLLSIQGAHSSPCNVVLPHPIDTSLLLSAGTDGFVHLWDIASGTKVFSYENMLNHGAMQDLDHKNKPRTCLDGGWNYSSGVAVLTDDYGRLLLFDTMDCQQPSDTTSVELVPNWMKEQYFASDYYELLYDSHGYAIDSRSNLPPNLSPRAVRCTHIGSSVGDAPNFALIQIAGPLPLCEKESLQERKALLNRSSDVRCRLTESRSRKVACDAYRSIISSRISGSAVVVGKTYGGVLIHGPVALDALRTGSARSLVSSGANFSATNGARLPEGNGGRNANRATRSLSSRYHYLEYEDIVSSEEEELNDEEFVPGDRSQSRVRANDARESDDSRSIAESIQAQDLLSSDEVTMDSNSPRRSTRRGRGQRSRLQRGSHRSRRRSEQRSRRRTSESHDVDDARVPPRISARVTGRKRYADGDSDYGSDIEELLSSNRRPDNRDSYNGQYFDDLQRGHMWKLPRGGDVLTEWLRRDESRSGYIGKKSYAPQVGDSVVYIPRAHYDTIIKHPATMIDTAPWKGFPTNSAWPVVLCKVVDVRYRFPLESLFKDHERSVVAIVNLEVTGIPKMRSEGGFPWPMPEFIHQRSRRSASFEVSLFQSGQVEFLVPEALYLWRQVSLEAAIRQNYDNPVGIQLFVFSAADEDDSSIAEDAALVRHPCRCSSVEGIFVSHDEDGNEQIHFELSGQHEKELHFQQCGYNSVFVKWEDNTHGYHCPWELNVAAMPLGDVPIPTGISESAQVKLLETLSELSKEDPRIGNFFFFPVDTRTYSDYDLMVEVPMDLGLVRKRLENHYYSNLQSFMADIKLIMQNCCKYNDERSEIVQVAMDLHQSFSVAVKEIEASEQDEEVDPEGIQKLLHQKSDALKRPARETRTRTHNTGNRGESTRPIAPVRGAHGRTRNSLEASSVSARNQRPTRGQISGALDNLPTARYDNPAAPDNVANRTRRSAQAPYSAVAVVPPSRSSRRLHSLPKDDPKSEEEEGEEEEGDSEPTTNDSGDSFRDPVRTTRKAASERHEREAHHISPSDLNTTQPATRPRRVAKKRYCETPSEDEVDPEADVSGDSDFEVKPSDDDDHNVNRGRFLRLNHVDGGRGDGRSLRSGKHTLLGDRERRSTRGRRRDLPMTASIASDTVASHPRHTRPASAGGAASLGMASASIGARDRSPSKRTRGVPKVSYFVPSSGDEDETEPSKPDQVEDKKPQAHAHSPRPQRTRKTTIQQRDSFGDSDESHGSPATHSDDDEDSSCESEVEAIKKPTISLRSSNTRTKIRRERASKASEDEPEDVGSSDSDDIINSKPTGKRKRPSTRELRPTRSLKSGDTKTKIKRERTPAASEDEFKNVGSSDSDVIFSSKPAWKRKRSSPSELPPTRSLRSGDTKAKIKRERTPATLEDESENADSSGSDDIISSKPAGKRKRSSPQRAPPAKKGGKKTKEQNKAHELEFPDVRPWPEIHPLQKCFQVARTVLKALRELDFDDFFHKPVVEAFPMVKDAYLSMISKPMDFETIEKQLRKYDGMTEIQQDIVLVFKNCYDFNGPETQYGQYAVMICKQLQSVFEDACRIHKADT